jgi:hypothetical protein
LPIDEAGRHSRTICCSPAPKVAKAVDTFVEEINNRLRVERKRFRQVDHQ